ncbi:hypothetical protein [Bradyrhizobium iriomotense]|uniref:hypothetical protein n=1 Tax=Bradyrhizobium iriomotense TaxID=441950 RepID=UPI001B8A8BD8|nr:hypothetical protein [Bradyrhizobium iriomotense]MBR0787078.1 hypothetical protein [Bradyrhizobium iriomotense]
MILGVFTSFFQLIGLAALALGAQQFFNAPLTPRQDLLLNLTVYAILLLIIFFRGFLSNDEPTRSQSFYRSAIVTFPLPGIWLMYAWPTYGG